MDADRRAPTTAQASDAGIDASCRWPVGLVLGFALCWLVVGGVLSVMSAVKLHAPGLLADFPMFTYGRLQPAAWSALWLGFGVQAGLAAAAWLVARLGGTPLVGAPAMIIAALLWNVGLKLGLLGVLMGQGTGLEGLDLPAPAFFILLIAYLGMAAPVLVTFARRSRPELYVSQWYLLGALFSFPWLYAAANIFAVVRPLRGVLQTAVQAWFVHGLVVLWFGFLGLAFLFYAIPRMTRVAIPSRNLAVFGFWSLALFGGLGGLGRYLGGPFPAYLLAIGVVGSVLTLFPIVAVGMNLVPSLRGRPKTVQGNPVLHFAALGLGMYLFLGLLGALNAFSVFRNTTQFTLFTFGLDQLTFLGFFLPSLLSVVYLAGPGLLGRDLPYPGLVRWHFRFLAVGVGLIGVAFLVGGWLQGLAMNDPGMPFFAVMKRYLPFASTGTLAHLVVLAGSLTLAVNALVFLVRRGAECCRPALEEWRRSPAPIAEVKA